MSLVSWVKQRARGGSAEATIGVAGARTDGRPDGAERVREATAPAGTARTGGMPAGAASRAVPLHDGQAGTEPLQWVPQVQRQPRTVARPTDERVAGTATDPAADRGADPAADPAPAAGTLQPDTRPAADRHGTVSVRDGRVHVRKPRGGGRWPSVEPGEPLAGHPAEVRINGRPLAGRHVVRETDRIEIVSAEQIAPGGIDVETHPNGLRAWVTVHPPVCHQARLTDAKPALRQRLELRLGHTRLAPEATADDVLAAAERAGVRVPLRDGAVQRALANPGERVLLAEGLAAGRGHPTTVWNWADRKFHVWRGGTVAGCLAGLGLSAGSPVERGAGGPVDRGAAGDLAAGPTDTAVRAGGGPAGHPCGGPDDGSATGCDGHPATGCDGHPASGPDDGPATGRGDGPAAGHGDRPSGREDGPAAAPQVEMGETLLVIRAGRPGRSGYTVGGEVLTDAGSLPPRLAAGSGVMLSKDGLTAIAEQPGSVAIAVGSDWIGVAVHEERVVEGNVEAGGRLHVRGNLRVGGSVEPNCDIFAAGRVEVGRDVLRARIESGGGIEIRGGVSNGLLLAGGAALIYAELIADCEGFVEAAAGLERAAGDESGAWSDWAQDGWTPRLRRAGFRLATALQKADMECDAPVVEFGRSLAEAVARRRVAPLDVAGGELSALLQQAEAAAECMRAALALPAHCHVGHLDYARLEVTGDVVVTGSGCYRTHIKAGGSVRVVGRFRSGSVAAAGDATFEEIGSPGEVVTRVQLPADGRFTADLVHPGTVVRIGPHTRVFQLPVRKVVLGRDAPGEVVRPGRAVRSRDAHTRVERAAV